MGRARILVVDDDESTSLLLSELLALEGFEAKVAADGVAGMSLLRKLDPALVILDYMMPGGGGPVFHHAVRAAPDLKGTPIILLSALPESKVAQGLQMDGLTYFMNKPYRSKELLAVVAQLLEEHPPRSAEILAGRSTAVPALAGATGRPAYSAMPRDLQEALSR